MRDDERSIPLAALPSDALRDGLTTFQDRLVERHPAQALCEEDGEAEKLRQLRDLYGTAVSARRHIERQILERRGRLPSLPSSNFGSDVYFGRLGTFGIESYLGLEEFSELPPIDVHSQMEQHYCLGTRCAKRGIL